jgi:hypothetical protein
MMLGGGCAANEFSELPAASKQSIVTTWAETVGVTAWRYRG